MNEEKTKGEEIIKVNCSYCGKEIECPKNMLNEVEKHACLDCFKNLDKKQSNNMGAKVHVDIPLDEAIENIASEFANKQTKEVFLEIWADHKDEMKNMSKKELAEKMFDEGLHMGFIGAFTYPVAMDEDKEDLEEEK